MAESPSSSSTQSDYTVNLLGLVAGISLIIVITKLSSYLQFWKLYFSFSSFVYSAGEDVRWESVLIKLLIPFLAGFTIYYLPARFSLTQQGNRFSSRINSYLANESELTAASSGFLSALLLAWPFISFWDMFALRELREKKEIFYVIYILYFFSYAYVSMLGAKLGKIRHMTQTLGKDESASKEISLEWRKSAKPLAMGVLSSVLATVLTQYLGLS